MGVTNEYRHVRMAVGRGVTGCGLIDCMEEDIANMYPVIHPSHSHWTRASMPQIDDTSAFVQWLESSGIHHESRVVSAAHLKPTQNEINLELSLKLVPVLDTRKYPILVSSDMHVLDGHNRWYAAKVAMMTCHVVVIDLEITALLHRALTFPGVRHSDVSSVHEVHA